jgi:hypothetical protein
MREEMASRREFPVRVTSSEDLPRPLGDIYTQALELGLCQHAVYAPPLRMILSGRGQRATGYLLMVFDERLFVADLRQDGATETFDVPLAEIMCIEVGVILLYSWFRPFFRSRASMEITIPFNTVGLGEFMAALDLVRPKLDTTRLEAKRVQPSASELPLKFQSALSQFLAPGEELIELAFQPEIRAGRRGWFGLLERQIAPPLLAALTTRQLLLMTEEPSRRGVGRKREGKYDRIVTYCPLSRIDSLKLEPNPSEGELVNLRLTLINEQVQLTISKVVSADAAPQFEWLGRCLIKQLARERRIV